VKISIILTDDDGNTFQGEVDLNPAANAGKHRRKRAAQDPPMKRNDAKVNFAAPIRAFVKQHGRSLGGPQRFALLVAYLSKGQPQRQVALADIERHWNKMKSLLDGKLNPAHSTRAKEHGWVDSPARGVYVLLPGWKGILDA
jgi:hypothetical protein